MLKELTKTKKYNYATIFLCLIFLLISLILGSAHKVGTFAVETDFYGVYAKQTINILSGKPYTYLHNPPGYEIFLGIIFLITKDIFIAAKILSSFSTVILSLLSYLIFKKLYNEKIAFITVIFLLIILLPYSFTASTDIPGAMFATIPILILLNIEKLSLKLCFIIGLTCGVAYLVRAETIFVLIGISLSILFILIAKNWKDKLIKIVILLIGFILITSPWFIYNWKLNGSPFASTAYLQVGLYFYKEKDREKEPLIEKASEENNTSPEVMFINPVKLLWKYLKNIPSRIELLAVKSSPFPLYLFLGGGIFFFLRNLNRKRLVYFLIWLCGFFLLGLIAFSLRHYFVLIPFTSLLIAYFFFNERFEVSKRTNLYIWLTIVFISFFLIKNSYNRTKSFFDSEPKYLLQAADFLKSRSSEADIIIARKPHLAYLSNLKGILLYENSAENYYYKSKLINARYIVYSDFEAELWPGLKVLNNPKNIKDYFTLVYQHKPTNTLIYEIK